MTLRWITATLGTSAWDEVGAAGADAVVDVRSLRDAGGNSAALLAKKIAEIGAHLRAGRRTVVCCDHGMSRSNALAAAALAQFDGSGFNAALERVLRATGEKAVKVDLIGDIRSVLGETENRKTGIDEIRVLLSGAEGFIGGAVRDALARSGLLVTTADAQAMRGAPVLLELAARASGAHCLVLLARPAVPNSNDGLGELLSQLRSALETCRACTLRLIFLSGHQVYAGHRGPELRPDEDLPTRPAGAIGEALYLGERMIELHREREGVEALIVRTSTLYGPGDRRPGFLRTFIQHALRGEEILTHHYRNGPPIVELLHARDFATGIALAVRQRLTGRLHLGPGQGITTPALAQTVARLAGSTSPVRRVDLPGEAANVILDCSRARAILGWAPETALEDGLLELIADLHPVGTIDGALRP
jgi:nucleoside-diphosphate-sugar epimerase